MKRITSVILLFLGVSLYSQAQSTLGSYLGDESGFYAETKQVNQFFRRFNNEEDKNGVRYEITDKRYRAAKLRKSYLEVLFDGQNRKLSPELKQAFIETLTNKNNPQFLDFHEGGWFAQVEALVYYKGQEKKATFYLELEKEMLGHKWAFTKVYFEPFHRMFAQGDSTEGRKKFLHPLSHEVDFMNLNKALQDKRFVEYYAQKDFQPDYLTLFFYEIKQGNLKFKTIQEVKFHFFQIDQWYFEISEFNRTGYNRGWLISNLAKVNDQQKNLLKKYIYNDY
ncbi:hypothetical protein AAG747_13540 [Rapidithrix thailandica]|uniref:YARHG domain-containing protein n=1 Tax=Rapidithrix thailandica TaxID=413964 RepID=A0AAW9S917_9BACT